MKIPPKNINPITANHSKSIPEKPPALGDWLIRPGLMLPLMIGLFLVFFGMAAFLGYQHLETTREHALISDRTTSTLLANVLAEHQKAVIGVLRSYASRPLFIAAVKQRNIAAARRHLANLKKNHEIDLTFVTDPNGILWLNYPIFPKAIGKDLSYRDWYKGISVHWKPYISEVFQLIVANRPLAAAICVPIFDYRGKVIGILATSQRLEFFAGAVERVPFSPHTTVTIVDRMGRILYSNRYTYRKKVTAYPYFSMIVRARTERRQQIEDSRHKDLGKLYLSIDPIGDSGWTVVIERKLDDIYRSEIMRLAEIGGTTLLLFVLVGLMLAYLRRAVILRKAGELLSAQQAALESEVRYQSLFENMLNGFAYCRMFFEQGQPTDFVYLAVNNAFETLTGLKDVVGKRVSEVIPGIRETDPGLFEVYGRVALTGVPERFETYVNALEMWFLISVYSPDKEYFVAVFDGITEQKQAEQKLRESEGKYRGIFENAMEGIYQTTLEGRYLSINPAFVRMFGFASAEEMMAQVTNIGKQIYVNNADRERLKASLADPGYVKEFETEVRRKDGATFWISINARAVRDAKGALLYFEGSSMDITDRKRAEEEIKELNAELEQRVIDRTTQLEAANKELEAFSYSVSHDLRAPLRSIDGFSQALIEEYREKLDETGMDYLNRVRKATQRMGWLIDDMLKLSRVTQCDFHRESVDLSKMFREMFEMFQKSEPDRIVEVVIQDGIVAQGDPYLLKIALGNLIDNAWKFTGKTSGARIEFGMFAKDGKTVCYIRDNGAGFDMAYTSKLFGAFPTVAHRR